MPSASAAIEMRPPSSVFRLSTKPSPRLPRSCEPGSRNFQKITSPGRAGTEAELVFFFAGAEPARALLDDERGQYRAARRRDRLTAMATQTSHSARWCVNVFEPFQDPALALAHGGGGRVPRGNRSRLSGSVSDQHPSPLGRWRVSGGNAGAAPRCPICKCDCCRVTCARRRMIPTEPSTRESSSMMMEYSM